jgi:hypothetical protein
MTAIAAPILPGQFDAWTKWMNDLNGSRKEEFRKFNARHGITQHRAWVQTGPDGSKMVIVVVDGPSADGMMPELATSTDPFDVWFREQVAAVHGFDFNAPPPPPAELLLDVGN